MAWLRKSGRMTFDPNTFRFLIHAAGLSRVLEHMMDGQFGILSAFRGQFTYQQNMERTENLKEQIRSWGLGFIPADGVWEGAAEASLFVPGISQDQIHELAAQYEQDAFVWGSNGTYAVIGTKDGATFESGNVQDRFHFLGTGDNADPASAYTEMRGRRWQLKPEEVPQAAAVAAQYQGGFVTKGRAWNFKSAIDLDRPGQAYFFVRGMDDHFGVPKFGIAIHDEGDGNLLHVGDGKTMDVTKLAVFLPIVES